VADEFVKGAKKPRCLACRSSAKEFTTDKATDFTAILTSIKAKKPDLVFFGGMDSVGGPMLKQMKALGIKAKFMGGDGICTEALRRLAGDGRRRQGDLRRSRRRHRARRKKAWTTSSPATRRSSTPTCSCTRPTCTTR
jgi:ABC-type branched-subunit amino acid transport system substrate-binding protein